MPTMRPLAAVLLGLVLTTAPGATISILQILHMQRLAQPAMATVVIHGAYLAGMLLGTWPAVALGARIGAAGLFTLGIVAMALITTLLYLPMDFFALLALRGLQGVAAAGLLTACYGLLRLIVPERRLSFGIGCGVAAITAGSAVLSILSGLAMSALGDWGIVLPVIPLAALILALAHKALPAAGEILPFDALGTALSLFSIGLLFAAMNLSFLRPVAAAVCLVVGLAALGLWLWQQWRRDLPMLPLDLLAKPTVALSFGAALLGTLATSGANVMLMSYLPSVYAEAPQVLSSVLMLSSVIAIAVALASGWFAGSRSPHRLAAGGAAIICIGLVGAAWHGSDISFLFALTLCALGRVLLDVGTATGIIAGSDPRRHLAAAGLFVFAGALGAVLGPFVVTVGPLMALGSLPHPQSMTMWLTIAAVAAALAIQCGLAARR